METPIWTLGLQKHIRWAFQNYSELLVFFLCLWEATRCSLIPVNEYGSFVLYSGVYVTSDTDGAAGKQASFLRVHGLPRELELWRLRDSCGPSIFI
ncbi:hypothetical protein R3P38DRAFT_3009647 [Favolaschia claudopus]|uniref:Uncharacterized protein n=1 Tax=Favolaschia claudopus TaxID=2862362 RepID=A0AAW0AKV2_9AGAR